MAVDEKEHIARVTTLSEVHQSSDVHCVRARAYVAADSLPDYRIAASNRRVLHRLHTNHRQIGLLLSGQNSLPKFHFLSG